MKTSEMHYFSDLFDKVLHIHFNLVKFDWFILLTEMQQNFLKL